MVPEFSPSGSVPGRTEAAGFLSSPHPLRPGAQRPRTRFQPHELSGLGRPPRTSLAGVVPQPRAASWAESAGSSAS